MTSKQKRRAFWWLYAVAGILIFTVSAGPVKDIFAGDRETYKGLRLFSDVLDLVEKNYVDEVDTKEMIHEAIQGMVNSLDPHSQLLPPEAFEEMQNEVRGEFGGIGIVITMQKNLLTVISPIEGTPAHKAGVQAGDIIVKIDGKPTQEMMLWEAVKQMRGPKGESVDLTVVREGEDEMIDFTLVRDIIPIESVRSILLEPGYGYVRVTNFQENTLDDLKAALAKMERGKKPLQGLVLDLRDNPGGLLNQAVDISDMFLNEGAIVSIKGRLKKHTRVFNAHANDSKQRKYPIVALINGGSASASEIVAGALQDHKRAVILGTTSFGKGSVQTVETLRDGYGLKFTIARYYTPSGKSIQAEGIVPDIMVKKRWIDDETSGEDIRLKEKDLANHLDAESGPKKDKKGASGAAEESDDRTSKKRRRSNRYGQLSIETLGEDNQVMRGLEILKGYHIFTDARG